MLKIGGQERSPGSNFFNIQFFRCDPTERNDCANDEETDRFFRKYMFIGKSIMDKVDFGKYTGEPVTRKIEKFMYIQLDMDLD